MLVGGPASPAVTPSGVQRNLGHRVEAMAPIENPDLQFRIDEIFEMLMSDDPASWELGPDWKWTKVAKRQGLSTHVELQDLAEARAQARF